MGLTELPPEMITEIASCMSPFNILRLSHTSTFLMGALHAEVCRIRKQFNEKWDVELHCDWSLQELVYKYHDEFPLPEDQYIRQISIQGKESLFGNKVDTTWLQALLKAFSRNARARCFEPDPTDDRNGLECDPLSEARQYQLLSCLVLALPSLVYLEIDLCPKAKGLFVQVLRHARVTKKDFFPEVKYVNMILTCDDMTDDEDIEAVKFGGVDVILDFFDSCYRQLELRIEALNQWEGYAGRVIMEPSSIAGDLPLLCAWDLRSARVGEMNALRLTRAFLEIYDWKQQWQIIEDDIVIHEISRWAEDDKCIESISLHKTDKGTILQSWGEGFLSWSQELYHHCAQQRT